MTLMGSVERQEKVVEEKEKVVEEEKVEWKVQALKGWCS